MKRKKFISLLDDLLFKEVLAHPDNRWFLEYFLETFLNLEVGSLHNKLNVRHSDVHQKIKYGDKSMNRDIVIDFNDTTIDIEAYTTFDAEALVKSTHYIMYIYSGVNIGDEYNKLKKVVQINIVDKVTPKLLLPDKVHSVFYMYDKDSNFDLLDGRFEIHYFRIDKVKTMDYNESDEMIKILKFIAAQNEKERRELMAKDEKLNKLGKWLADYIDEEKHEKMMEEWEIKIAQNRIKKEYSKKIAKSMLKENEPIDKITKYTGLTQEEIASMF